MIARLPLPPLSLSPALPFSQLSYVSPVKREFILNILFLIFINVLIKPFFIFGIDLTVQNRVGADYGLYFALLNFSYIFQIISDFGLQNFNNRQVSRHPHLLEKYFPDMLGLKVVLGALYLLLSLGVAIGVAGYEKRALGILGILVINQLLVQLILFLRSNVSGLGHYRLDSFFSALDKLLMLVTGGLLLWGGWWPVAAGIEAFALSQTVALLFTALIIWLSLQRVAGFRLRPSVAMLAARNRSRLAYFFRESLPYALVILLMMVYNRIDAVLLERLLPDGAAHAEVYAGAYRLLDASNMLGYLFASLLLPMFARMLYQGDAIRPLVSMSFKMIWVGSLTLATAVYFSREPLVGLMMPGRATPYRWDTLGWLIWAFVPVSTTYIFSTLLTANRQLAQMNRFFVAGILLDVSLNLLFIPRWQAEGSAVATLITQIFVAAAMVWICLRTFDFRPGARGLVQILGSAVLIPGLGFALHNGTAWPWHLQLGLTLLAGPVALLLSGMIDISRLRRMLSER